MLRFDKFQKINERLAEINLPSLDAKTVIANYRKDLMQDIDDNLDGFVQKEIEHSILEAGYEVLGSRAIGLEQFYYNFKIQKGDFIYALTVNKNFVQIKEGTEDLKDDKEDFWMYVYGYDLGQFETIQKALYAAKDYDSLRKQDEANNVYSILWNKEDNIASRVEYKPNYIYQKIDPALLQDKVKLEKALNVFWSTYRKDKSMKVPTIYLDGKRYYFNFHGLRSN